MNTVAGVITGAGGDIGIAVAAELGSRGAAVLCVDRTDELAVRGADAVREAGGAAEAYAADVSVEANVIAYAGRCRELWGQATFFFNNAGIEGAESPLLSYPVEEWDRVM